jgi:hypothetical protein
LGIDAVHFAGFDDGADGGGAFTADARACEQPVAPADRNAAQGSFGDIVVDLEPTIVEKASECCPAIGAIDDGLPAYADRRRRPAVILALLVKY